MTPKPKPKLRMAPSPGMLAEQQDAAARLLLLDQWTEEPNNPPPTGVAASLVESQPVVQAPQAKKVPAKPPQKPWEGEGAAAPHPYHVVASEGLFQKMDFVWKRQGHKSMREWVLKVLDTEANKALKSLGEL